MRLRVLLAAATAALAAPGLAHASEQALARPGHLYRPNPIFTGTQLDYINPLPTPTHGVAMMPPLSEAATAAAVADQERLAYRLLDDLGGFIPAPIGQIALSSGGHEVVGSTKGRAQIPLFQHHAGGKVNAFTFTGSGPGINPGNTDNGKGSVSGLGVPTPVPPATSNPRVPPANQGFGGAGQNTPGGKGDKGVSGHAGGGGTPSTGRRTTTRGGGNAPGTTSRTTRTTTTRTRTTTTRQTTTQATVSTTAPSTTVPTTTTTPGGGGGGGGSGDCGGDGISIVPDAGHPDCKLQLKGAKPGDSESEVLTVTNVSGSPYTLALKAVRAPNTTTNHLFTDLDMAVWENGTPTPAPLPPLSFWMSQYNDLITLQPGDSVSYRIELYLPVESGNVDQNLWAFLDFKWKGH